MDSSLQSISKIFTEKLYRIPDYQRGYAWGEKQLKDFWNDIMQLEDGKNHYVGVLTLEKVPDHVFRKWDDDLWIIESKSFEPYYVVDGQQRLTTTIILIQSITEVVKKKAKLNYVPVSEIRQRFIFDSRDEGISRSYIFGYEKDNPSYEFLKTKIFNENSSSAYTDEETIYTNNLENSKNFFINKLKELKFSELQEVYKKITQHLLFNIYTINSDIDVFIAFETMNNRGKPLSNLELLKNRLIYLSTKFNVVESEKERLRKIINNSWKAIYHNLGKNKENPLNDDFFLLNHFIIYFGEEYYSKSNQVRDNWSIHRLMRDNYMVFLLEMKFTAKNISIGNDKEESEFEYLTVNNVYEYAQSLQKSVKVWYEIFNPHLSTNFNEDEKLWIDKLNRIDIEDYLYILLNFYLKKPSKTESVEFLKIFEKYFFALVLVRNRLYSMRFKEQDFKNLCNTVKKTIQFYKTRSQSLKGHKNFKILISDSFKNMGFYNWSGIRYFLFEYDLSLKETSRTKRKKIEWSQYVAEKEDYISVEHIFPQTPKLECWTSNFGKFKPKEQTSLANSLGNLLPLAKPKNSSLQNKCFLEKVDNKKDKTGYRYGSYSENEVSKLRKWTPICILNRGMDLLKFMEKRWEINLGTKQDKINLLNLRFLEDKEIKQKDL